MFLSVFDIFKIGIGPSSSHTVGPMVAARRFVDELRTAPTAPGAGAPPARRVSLHGSLAFTGKGHGTDRAIASACSARARHRRPGRGRAPPRRPRRDRTHRRRPAIRRLAFDPETDIVFDYGPALPGHANGMIFRALDAAGACTRRAHLLFGRRRLRADRARAGAARPASGDDAAGRAVPYPFATAAEMLAMGEASGLSIAEMKRANETGARAAAATSTPASTASGRRWKPAWTAASRTAGTLPGGLKVKRRAADIHQKLLAEHGANSLQPHRIMDWLGVYAMAVNEENAAGGRVVTAPTNGAAGVIPAVIRYYLDHCVGADREGVRDLPAGRGGDRRHHQAQRLDLRRRGRLPGRGRLGLGDGGGRARGGARRAPTRRSRTPPRSRSSIISA